MNNNQLVELINLFLEDYRGEVQNATKELKTKYSADFNTLEKIYSTDYSNIIVKVGIGNGRLSKCPFISLLDKRITSTPSYGVYIIFIFKEDMTGFYLMLNQGVSFLNYKVSEYETIRQFWTTRLEIDTEESDINLSDNPNRIILEYQKAYILSKYYNKNFNEEQLLKDLKLYLDYYSQVTNIILSEFGSDINRMYKEIVSKADTNNILAVVQMNDRNKYKEDNELFEEFVNDLIKDTRKTNGIVFFIGAGMSMPLGIPDWNTLIFKLLAKKIDLDISDSDSIKKYVKEYASTTALAAVVKNTYQDEREFIDTIHEICYEKVALDDISNSPLGHIAKMSMSRKTLVKSVVTYNYDNLLEIAIDKINKDGEYVSVYDESQIRIDINRKLPIYHVHGYIPKENFETNSSHIILTEKEYHELYSDFFNWSNIIQMKYLMECTCVFLGLSFSDPNQRRIIESISKFIPDSRSNYLIISNKIPDDKEVEECSESLNSFNGSWNEKNYKLKTYYINGKSYEEINKIMNNLLNKLQF